MIRTTRSRLRRCAAVAGALVVLAGCGSDDGTTTTAELPVVTSPDFITTAAVRTVELESLRFDVSLTGEGAMDGTLSVTGAVRTDPLAAQIEVDLSGLDTGDGGDPMLGMLGDEPVEVRVVDDVLYARAGSLGQALAGSDWVALPIEESGGSPVDQLDVPVSADELMDMLEDVAEVEDLGEEEVRGVATRHVRATVDLEAVAARAAEAGDDLGDADVGAVELPEGMASELPVDVWIDADGLVRKLTATVTDGTDTVSIEAEIYDLDGDFLIEAPADATELDPALLGAFG